MKIITDSRFKSAEEIEGYANRERYIALCEGIEKFLPIEYESSDISESEFEKILGQIHTAEYLEHAKIHPAYIPASLYLQWVIHQAKKILAWEEKSIFYIGYPAGHHAEKNWKPLEWFSLFNNIAWVAKFLTQKYNTILIVDFDVHQGNGTKDIIRWDTAIHLVSFQPRGLYPLFHNDDTIQDNYSGIEYDIVDDASIIIQGIMCVVQEVHPDIILVSAGFDAHKDDPFSPTALIEEDYAKIGSYLKTLGLPVLAVLEWGYNYVATAKSIIAFGKNL